MTSVGKAATAVDIGQEWVDAGDASTSDAFGDLHAEDGESFDVTCGVRRRGHDLNGLHRRLWRAAISDL